MAPEATRDLNLVELEDCALEAVASVLTRVIEAGPNVAAECVRLLGDANSELRERSVPLEVAAKLQRGASVLVDTHKRLTGARSLCYGAGERRG